MQFSQTTGEITKALVAFHREVGKVGKDALNPHFKNRYASLDNMLDTVSETLSRHGLSVVQLPDGDSGLSTYLFHESGEWIGGTSDMHLAKDDPQGNGSAITYSRRYSLGGLLGLVIGEDDDGNSSTPPEPERREYVKSQPSPQGDFWLPDGDHELRIVTQKSGRTDAGKAWNKVRTTQGDAWNNSGSTLDDGDTYRFRVANKAIVEVYG